MKEIIVVLAVVLPIIICAGIKYLSKPEHTTMPPHMSLVKNGLSEWKYISGYSYSAMTFETKQEAIEAAWGRYETQQTKKKRNNWHRVKESDTNHVYIDANSTTDTFIGTGCPYNHEKQYRPKPFIGDGTGSNSMRSIPEEEQEENSHACNNDANSYDTWYRVDEKSHFYIDSQYCRITTQGVEYAVITTNWVPFVEEEETKRQGS